MGREARRVPPGWTHPRDANGHLVPLYGEDATAEQAKWDEERLMWDKGFVGDYPSGWSPKPQEAFGCTFVEWSGERPKTEDYMPAFDPAEATHYQMYEDTTEGTPISPVMESPEALARWLVDNGASYFGKDGASYDTWLRVARGQYGVTSFYAGMVPAWEVSDKASGNRNG